jgi:hypothetical protein
MQIHLKSSGALVANAVFVAFTLCQAAEASLLNTNGTSVLADAYGTATGPEALTVSWSVVENALDVYTYTYVVNNPAGDVLLPDDQDAFNSGAPEIVDTYEVSFNASASGAVVSGPTGGLFAESEGSGGLFWFMSPVAPGTNSGTLSFQSDDPPTLGNASASDANPPSPWSSSPDGQTVPVPMTASAPDSLNTLVWLAGMAPLLALALKRKATRP